VLRMAVLYAVAAWLIMQVAEVMMSLVGLPAWAGRATFAVLAVGFPIALIFSWFYEITPEGISLEKDVDRSESITHVTGRRLDFIVISLLCAAVILFAYDKWWMHGPPVKSIAVLPFVAMSSGEDDEYFSDGLSEELLNSLTRIDGLKVAGRSSSFYYKGKNEDLRMIGAALGVAHVLEGSVRKSGDNLRISAQLIQVSDGFHLWSNAYDRKADDIFAIQTDIATQVAEALKVTLLGEHLDALSNYGTTNAEARSLYLIAKARTRQTISIASPQEHYSQVRSTRRLLEDVVSLDPQYAEAWAALARVFLKEANVLPDDSEEFITRTEGIELATNAIDRATELAPDLSDIKLAQADLQYRVYRWKDVTARERAALAYDEAIAAAPENPEVLEAAATFYHSILRLEQAAALYDRALLIDPLSDIRLSRARLLEAGKPAEAYREFIRTGELYPKSNWMEAMAYFEFDLGHYHHALAWSEENSEEYFQRPFIWVSLGDLEKALHELKDRPAEGGTKLWQDRAEFFFKRDYQGFRDWILSDDVRAAFLAIRPACWYTYALDAIESVNLNC